MTNKSLSEPNHIERGAQMTAAAREELKAVLKDKFAEFMQLATTSKFTAVKGVNIAREIGAQIELFTGHEKLLPAEFNALSTALAFPIVGKSAPIEFAKACVALHHKFDEPVSEFAVAAVEWERLLVQLELLPEPERGTAASTPPPTEPVKNFLGDVIKVSQECARLIEKYPVEQWESFNRKSFLKQGAPFFDAYQRVQAIEAGK